MASLTDDQRRRIEENRKKALSIRAAKQLPGPISNVSSSRPAGASASSKPYIGPSSNSYSSNFHTTASKGSSPTSKFPSPFATSNGSSTSSNQSSTNNVTNGSAFPKFSGTATNALPVTNAYSNSSKSSFNNHKSVQENKPIASLFYGSSKAAGVTVSFSLLSNVRFTVDFPFNDTIVKVLKTIPGKLYGNNFVICTFETMFLLRATFKHIYILFYLVDPKHAKWNFPLSSYNVCKSQLQDIKEFPVVIKPLPNYIIKVIFSI